MSANDSFLEVPVPTACSTEERPERKNSAQEQIKQDVKRNLMNMDVSTESLGILSLDDMKPTKDSLNNIHNMPLSYTLEERCQIRESTRVFLEKYSLKTNSSLPESTVNESDLRESSSSAVITPSSAKASTKSTINESDLLHKSNITNRSPTSLRKHSLLTVNKFGERNTTESISAYINNLKMQFEAADSSTRLTDIIGNGTKQSFELDSGMFQSAEDMKELFEADQKAWRQKYASIPNVSRVSLSSEGNISAQFDEKVSMGEFFRQKSDHCSLLCASSPSKREPISLANSTTIDDDKEDTNIANMSILSAINHSIASVLGVSAIQNMIADGGDTPNQVLEKLINAPLASSSNNFKKPSTTSIDNQPSKITGTSSSRSTNKMETSTSTLLKDGYYNSRSSLGSPGLIRVSKFSRYASSADLRTPTKDSMPSSTKIYSTKSLNSITDNKENVLSPRRMEGREEKNRTLTSCRSTSSMESIPDGMMKLASTKDELVWGCVKEGRSADQDVTIRNKNNRRVKYQIHANNTNFKLNRTDFQGDKGVIVLHPLETRKIVVTCSPNAVGPQTGNLFFTPIVRKEEQINNHQHIVMYAYGGHVNIQIKNHTRDPTGKLWFSLGCIDGRQELSADFAISNTGSIDGFVSLVVHSKSHCAYDDISLTPSKVVIKRGSETNVRVRFRPSKNDLQLINNALGNKGMKTCEIAVIRMLSGADISRQRINKMFKKIPKDHHMNVLEHAGQLSAPYQNAQRGEDIRHFNESTKAMKSMMQALDNTEISLLVDRDMDATLLPEIDDSTVLFKTMIGPDESSLMDLFTDNSYLKSFNVEPSKVILTPPAKCGDYFLLSSNYDRPVEFSVTLSPGGTLTVSPNRGEVNPGEIRKIKIECGCSVTMSRQDFNVIFEIEDEVLKVIVSVLNL